MGHSGARLCSEHVKAAKTCLLFTFFFIALNFDGEIRLNSFHILVLMG